MIINEHGGYRPGSGRPPLPDSEVRKGRLIKLTDVEWEFIKEKAAAENLSASEYVRRKVLLNWRDIGEQCRKTCSRH